MQDKDNTLLQSFYEAVGDMPNPVKDTSGYGYKYETLDQVIGIIRPALRAHGCDFTQGIVIRDGREVLETQVFNNDTVMTMDERFIEPNQDPQKKASFETYMRRYSLKSICGLAGEDDDGQRAKPKEMTVKEADTLLKKTLMRYFDGDKEEAMTKYMELMNHKGAASSLPYIKQQIERFS